jgi:hypothetical protein
VSWESAALCIACFRKLKGPHAEAVTVQHLEPGERWQPCTLCKGPCDAVPGIYYRLWLEEPPRPPNPEAA